jgi:hypothetical protein
MLMFPVLETQITQVEVLPPVEHRAPRERLRYKNREVVILPALADGGERCNATREIGWASLVFFFLLFPPYNYCSADRHK